MVQDERHRQPSQPRLELHPVLGPGDVDLEMPAERRDALGDRLEQRGGGAAGELVHHARGAEPGGIEPPQVGLRDGGVDHGDAEEPPTVLAHEILGDRVVVGVGTAIHLHAALDAERGMQRKPRFARAKRRRVFALAGKGIALEPVEDVRVAVDRARRQRAFRRAQPRIRR